MTKEQIQDTFTHHSIDAKQVRHFEEIRGRMTDLVVAVSSMCPDSRERSMFITLCQQAQMMANASIAIHGIRPGSDTIKAMRESGRYDGKTIAIETDGTAYIEEAK